MTSRSTKLTDDSSPDSHGIVKQVDLTTRLSHFHRTAAREERGLSWSAGLIVDLRPGGLLETVMVNDADGSMYTMRAVYVASLTRKE